MRTKLLSWRAHDILMYPKFYIRVNNNFCWLLILYTITYTNVAYQLRFECKSCCANILWDPSWISFSISCPNAMNSCPLLSIELGFKYKCEIIWRIDIFQAYEKKHWIVGYFSLSLVAFCKHKLKQTIYVMYHVTHMLHNNVILRLDEIRYTCKY